MSIAQTGFDGARVQSVTYIHDTEHPEYGGSNLEILDAGGVQSIEQMTDPEGHNVLVLSMANQGREPEKFVFKNMSGIEKPVQLATDIAIRTDNFDSNNNYGGVERVTEQDLQGYKPVEFATNVDQKLMDFTRASVSHAEAVYNNRTTRYDHASKAQPTN